MYGLTILGNNSALPAHDRHPTSQALYWNNQVFLIDCGEGTQLQMQRYKIKPGKIGHIFISHLHGDHYFGLIGLLTSFNLAGRSADLFLHAPAELKPLIDLQLSLASTTLKYKLYFNPLQQDKVLIETDNIKVSCFETRHRIPCFGFVFEELKPARKIIKHSVHGLMLSAEQYAALRNGDDVTTSTGKTLKNAEVTTANDKTIKYAYCADTIYTPQLAERVMDATLVYHEATFLHDMLEQAESRFHTTALQAGEFAQLCNPTRLLIGHYSSRYTNLDAFEAEVKSKYINSELTHEGITYLLR